MEEISYNPKVDYYTVGNRTNIVYSNSFASWLNPDEGGSIQKAMTFFDRDTEKKETRSMDRGKIVHEYIQYPKTFTIAEIPKPDGMLGTMTELFFTVMETVKTVPGIIEPVSDVITSDHKRDNNKAAEIFEIQAAYEKLTKLLECDSVVTVIKSFRLARANSNSYKSYTETVLIEKFISEGLKYYKQMYTVADKTRLTTSEMRVIESAKESLIKNSSCCELLNLSNSIFSNDIQEWKELDIYFEVDGIKCKARIDRLEINHKTKTIKIIDAKTTSKSAYLFSNTCEFYRYYRQIAFYKKAVMNWIKQRLMIQMNESLKLNDEGNFTAEFDGEVLNYKVECYFVVVEMQGDFISIPYLVSEVYLLKGLREAKSLIDRLKYHIDNQVFNKSMEEHLGNGVLLLKEPIK